jgi:hypothetical protein
MRTDRGCIYASRSADAGESWNAPEPTSLVAPVAPASARRLPGGDEIVILYNDRRGVPYSPDRGTAFHHRTPLAAALSSDGGRSWHSRKLVEPNLLDLKLCIVPTAAWTA